jgi:uncharacterized membrane protein
MDGLRNGLTIGAALGCGLMAGLFYAFSAVVMPSLEQRPTSDGVRTMQTINVVIVNPLFMVIFVGTAAASLGLVVISLASPDRGAHVDAIVAGALYLIGAIVVTGVANIPRNDAIDALDPGRADATDVWLRFLSEWTAWNHVRTVSCITALILLLVALVRA